MKRKRFTQKQIIGVLKELESGIPAPELGRKHGVCIDTIYRWKSKYGGMEINEAKRLKSLEEENGRLKRLVADQVLDIQILKDINSKNWYSPLRSVTLWATCLNVTRGAYAMRVIWSVAIRADMHRQAYS